MAVVSQHAGSQVTFEEAAQRLWEQDCSPLDESHILPKSSISDRDPLSKIAKILKPSLILRKFTVNNALFRDSKDFGLIPPDRVPQCDMVDIDALVISQSAGVVLFFYLPNKELPKRFISKKKAAISAFCSLLSMVLDPSLHVQIWLLANKGEESKELESPSLPAIQVFPRSQLAAKAKRKVDASAELGAELYVEVCKVLNALWRPRVTKLGHIRHGSSHLNGQPDSKNIQKHFKNLEDFLRDCESALTKSCPKWNNYEAGRPYMVSNMFEFQRKDLTDKIGGRYPVVVDKDYLQYLVMRKWCKAPINESEVRIRTLNDNVRGQEAEYLVYENIEWNARKTTTTLVSFSNLKFESKADHGYPLRILPEGTDNAEMDFVCISPEYGVHLLEVKGPDCFTKDSTVQDRLKKAAQQLENFERCLISLCRELKIPLDEKRAISVKAVVFPFLSCIDLYMKSGRIRRQITAGRVTTRNNKGIPEAPSSFFHYKGLDVWCLGGQAPAQWSWILEKYLTPASGKKFHVSALYRKLSPVLARISAIRRYGMLEDAERIAHHQFSSKSKPKPEGWKTTKEIPAPKSLNIMFLTDEQMNAWNGPAYQIIRGSAGTGKSVLLMARMRDLLERGEHVMVIARPGSIDLYEAFLNNTQHLRANAKLIDRSRMHERFHRTLEFLVQLLHYDRFSVARPLIPPPYESVWSVHERAELIVRLQSDLQALHRPPGHSPWNILIDDGFLDIMKPPNPDGSTHDHEFLIDALLETRVMLIASLWLAYDHCIFHPRYYHPTLGLRKETDDEKIYLYNICYFIVEKVRKERFLTDHSDMKFVAMNRILRSSRNVMQSSHVHVVPADTIRGHNVAGMVPRVYDLTGKKFESYGIDLLSGIHCIVCDELAENIPKKDGIWLLRHAAVIVEWSRPTSFLEPALLDYFNRNELPAAQCHQLKRILNHDDQFLTVDLSWSVHSIEWLIVFLIRSKRPDTGQRVLYAARSRAVMLLVEIVVDHMDVIPYVPRDKLIEGDIHPIRIPDVEDDQRALAEIEILNAADPEAKELAMEAVQHPDLVRHLNNCGHNGAEASRILQSIDALVPANERREYIERRVIN